MCAMWVPAGHRPRGAQARGRPSDEWEARSPNLERLSAKDERVDRLLTKAGLRRASSLLDNRGSRVYLRGDVVAPRHNATIRLR